MMGASVTQLWGGRQSRSHTMCWTATRASSANSDGGPAPHYRKAFGAALPCPVFGFAQVLLQAFPAVIRTAACDRQPSGFAGLAGLAVAGLAVRRDTVERRDTTMR